MDVAVAYDADGWVRIVVDGEDADYHGLSTLLWMYSSVPDVEDALSALRLVSDGTSNVQSGGLNDISYRATRDGVVVEGEFGDPRPYGEYPLDVFVAVLTAWRDFLQSEQKS